MEVEAGRGGGSVGEQLILSFVFLSRGRDDGM